MDQMFFRNLEKKVGAVDKNFLFSEMFVANLKIYSLSALPKLDLTITHYQLLSGILAPTVEFILIWYFSFYI